jgi:hypothetical protein
LSEEKKKMNYYYGGKEKSAGEIKKSRSDLGSYSPRNLEREFNRMIQSFQRDFEDFWETSKRAGGELEARARTAISPVMDTMMPSVDLLCGCGGFYGTTRLATAIAVAFLFQAVVQRLTRCGSGLFLHTPT